ncbi:MAG TPA: hypothetical protein VN025_19005 [Candidatus Dormibacteraeota bacterium]|jgi:hypothetical protein|nr:hypothetical protein [Candidatus Dormibacteraeota bacterium]
MNLKIAATLIMSLAFSSALAAQNSAPAQAPGQASASGKTAATDSTQAASQNGQLGVGTAFNATLDRSLDSKKLKVGDAVMARTAEDVRVDGKTILPKGSKIIGHVTQTSAKSNGDAESSLMIVFDKAELKGKQEIPIYATIQAMATPAPPPVPAGADGNFVTDSRTELGGQRPISGVAPNVGNAPGASVSSAPGVSADSAARATIDAAGRPVNEVTGATNNATGGVNAAGQLALNSRGVFGINGVALKSLDATGKQGPVITSENKSVRLDDGTRLLLMSRAQS